MPATLEEVKHLIKEQFPGSDQQVWEEPDHRIVGVIRSGEFKRKNSQERNRMVRERVRDKLGLRGLNVGVLFTLAPGEDLDD